MTSTELNIQQAIAAVMGDVREVAKKDRNQAQNFSFRGIDAVVNAVGPALRKHGVVVMPEIQNIEYSTVEVGKQRTSMGHVRVIVKYRFTGPAGDQLEATVPGEAMDSGDKATAKAMSVAFRTALLQALALPTDDRDPDADSYERAIATPAKPLIPFDHLTELMDSIFNATELDQLAKVTEQVGQWSIEEEHLTLLRSAFWDKKSELEKQEGETK